ncbi:transposase [Klebsiella michiganensis]|uniref:Transposase n=1 Tax=Klebsiella michiganensis TaxID=1134687 RepID=A0A7H4PQF4_9ENTR|nr:transposase [Klebsiella michiganensis]
MAKQKFKITNWSAYNKVLRQRGSLTVWLDESAITDLAQQRQTTILDRLVHNAQRVVLQGKFTRKNRQ